MLMTLTAFAAGCDRKPGAQSDPEGGPQAGDSDRDRLQGVWAVEKYEAGDPERSPSPEEVKAFRFHFDGNKLRIRDDGEVASSFVLDTASNPKVMIVTALDENGRPRKGFASEGVDRSEWLYKFDGEALVLAVVEGPTRPSNFTPRPPAGRPPAIIVTPGTGPKTVKDDNYVPAVNVLRLKKSNETPPAPKPRPEGSRVTRPTKK
jgi:uncharacterized protein (TIGR03067 family)